MSYPIEIKNLSKYYQWREKGSNRHFTALEGIDLKIPEGEVMGFIGGNGAGKSTLLKILARITPPSGGEVKLHGTASALLEVGTGFHPELSGRENVFLNGAILGMQRREIRRRFDQIVAFAGVEPFLEVPVKRYSSGMFVRLAFSVAAHLRSPILLIDEVLAVGDVEFQQRCLERMREATREEGRTVVFVSHQLHHVRELCQRVGHLEAGHLQKVGEANEIVDHYLEKYTQKARQVRLDQRPDRRGNGAGHFLSLNLEGQEKEALPCPPRTGQPARLEAQVQTRQEGTIDLQLNVIHPSGHFLTTLNSRLTGQTFTRQAGHHTFTCEIPQLPLMPGTYHLRAHLFLNGQAADIVEHALEFTVEEGDYYHNGQYFRKKLQGLFIPQNWQSL